MKEIKEFGMIWRINIAYSCINIAYSYVVAAMALDKGAPARDIIDEFIWQYNDYAKYRARLARMQFQAGRCQMLEGSWLQRN